MLPRRRPPDFLLFVCIMALLAFGLIMVYSASEVTSFYRHNGDVFYYLKKQVLWSVLGLGAMVVAMNLDYWRIRRLVIPALLASFVLLIMVLIPGIGKTVNGAQRWINLGFFAFQPSEIIKLSLVTYVAWHLAQVGDKIRTIKYGLLPVLVVLGLACVLILLQPDLGTAIAAAGTIYVMLFAGGARGKHLSFLASMGLAAVSAAIYLEPYRMKRFLAFLDPFEDPLGAGFHIIQSLYAIGSGGLFGLGLGQSRQKFFYLPEQHTDFIYAIIGEELGFVGAALVILLFVVFAWRGLRIAITARDSFGSMMAVGLTTMISLQAIVNLGVVTGSMPITGIPLPFISFGGTSLVFVLTGVGMLLNISRYCEYR